MTKTITAQPFTTQYGTIEVPDGLSEEEVREYVYNHFDEIKFDEPDLDYAGTDLEISD